MRSSLALICDSANVSSDGKLNIMGAFSVIKARNFPANHHQLSLVLWIDNVLGQTGPCKLTARFLGSDGDAGAPITVSINFRKGQTKAASIINIRNLEIPKEGDYCFEVTSGEKPLASIPLRAILIEKK